MKISRLLSALLLGSASVTAAHAGLPRFPQPTAHGIVFVADGNVWKVPRQGGTAIRLTTAQGQDFFPRVSPDGKWIAYTEANNSGTAVWVIPAAGGKARRLTFHPAEIPGPGGIAGPDDIVVTWTRDSKNIVYISRRDSWNFPIQSYYEVPVTGGDPKQLPVDDVDSSVGLATYSPDGKSIAYNRIFRNFRNWKRYYGGLAQDVYTYNFTTKKLDQVTHWIGTDTSPMWYGNKIYFLSDRGSHRRLNIWVHDLTTGKNRQVTHFTDYDVDFPALGNNAISFQEGGKLYLLTLPDEKLRVVPVSLPADGVRVRPHVIDAKKYIRHSGPGGQTDFALAPNGERTLLSARGDIYSVPTQHGATRDLTNTQGADEDHPSWSPDGKYVAYTTDSNGNWQMAIRPAEGGPQTLLTDFKSGYLYGAVWSPDGKMLSFSDANHHLWLVNRTGGKPTLVAEDKDNEIHDQSFSPDGRWLAFSMSVPGALRSDLYLYNIAAGKLTCIDNHMNVDQDPKWSADGKYLYFVSARNENMAFSSVDFNFAEVQPFGIYAIALAKDTPSAVAPRSDEGSVSGQSGSSEKADSEKAKGKGKDKDKSKATPGDIAPITIDMAGLMDRAVALPIQSTRIAGLSVRSGHIFYLSKPLQLLAGSVPDEDSELHVYDIKSRKDALVADHVSAYSLARDGKKVLVLQGKDFSVIPAQKNGMQDSDHVHQLDLSHMRMVVDPRKEWTEMFNNAWRMERDIFVNPKMNGVNWQEVHDKYAKLLPEIGSRYNLNYLIGQMQGELSNSHTYVGGGDFGDTGPKVHPGVLGVNWALDKKSGRYRIAKIFPGDNTRPEYRSPLSAPGLGVKVGDYVLAINGVELKAPATPGKLLQTSDTSTPVELAVADSPDGKRRIVRVKPIGNEVNIREAAWIKHNRDTVNRLSDGKIGYVYLTDMDARGMQQFMRQFYAQTNKDAMIIDDRWNGGGFIAPVIIQRLRRILTALDVGREGGIDTTPQAVVNGPKVVLLNHWSGSDGDIFPWLFKKDGMGELIGTRSWGGVRGIRGGWSLMDGGAITIPEASMYGTNSKWVIENHGVDPDIVVHNTPAELRAGHDMQLETAVKVLMKKLKDRGPNPPPPPSWNPPYPTSGLHPPKGK